MDSAADSVKLSASASGRVERGLTVLFPRKFARKRSHRCGPGRVDPWTREARCSAGFEGSNSEKWGETPLLKACVEPGEPDRSAHGPELKRTGPAVVWAGSGKTEYTVPSTEYRVRSGKYTGPSVQLRERSWSFETCAGGILRPFSLPLSSRNPVFWPVALTWRKAKPYDAPLSCPSGVRAWSAASNGPLERTNMHRSRKRKWGKDDREE